MKRSIFSHLPDAMLGKFGKLTTQQEVDLKAFGDHCQAALDTVTDEQAAELANLLYQSLPTKMSRDELENWIRGELGRPPK